MPPAHVACLEMLAPVLTLDAGARIYAPAVLAMRDALAAVGQPLRGLAHVTGGGLPGNVPRALPDGLGARLDPRRWTAPSVIALVAALMHKPDLLLPLPLLVQLVFTVGLALFFSALTVHFRDLQDILGHILHLWFWGSPILYFYGDTRGAVRTALRLNPLSHVIVSYQQMLFTGRFDHWRGLLLAGVAALVMLALGSFLFDRLRDTLAEEV